MLQKCAPSADGGAERITEGLKMGLVREDSQWSCWSWTPRIRVAWSGNEENGNAAISPLLLNPSIYPEVRTAEVQSS